MQCLHIEFRHYVTTDTCTVHGILRIRLSSRLIQAIASFTMTMLLLVYAIN